MVSQRFLATPSSSLGDPWERTVWPKPAIHQAISYLAIPHQGKAGAGETITHPAASLTDS